MKKTYFIPAQIMKQAKMCQWSSPPPLLFIVKGSENIAVPFYLRKLLYQSSKVVFKPGIHSANYQGCIWHLSGGATSLKKKKQLSGIFLDAKKLNVCKTEKGYCYSVTTFLWWKITFLICDGLYMDYITKKSLVKRIDLMYG